MRLKVRLFAKSKLIGVLCVAMLIAACDDPSSAGLELVDDEGARPTVLQEVPTLTAEEEVRDETGGFQRVLAGTVADPISGTVSTSGYMDFSEATNPTSAFRNGPVASVTLELVVDYVYGDTMLAGTIEIRDMDSEWEALGVASDSTLFAGALVTSMAFSPTDSVISIPMPPEWITANGTILTQAGSDTLFHGFELTTMGANAVIGFDTDASTLSIESGGVTIGFPVNRGLTTATRTVAGTPPAERLLIQDTAGPGVAIAFDLSDDDLVTAVVNHAQILVTLDTLAWQANQPGNFVRPTVSRLSLQAVTASGILFLQDSAIINGTATFSTEIVRAAIQGLARTTSTLQNFRVMVDADEMGVGTILIKGPPDLAAPVAEITYSKIQ